MTVTNDLSLSTLVISLVCTGAIALVGWGLKETGKTLISVLIKTIAKVEALDVKIVDVIKAVGLFPKFQQDLNEFYRRLKELEDKARTDAGP